MSETHVILVLSPPRHQLAQPTHIRDHGLLSLDPRRLSAWPPGPRSESQRGTQGSESQLASSLPRLRDTPGQDVLEAGPFLGPAVVDSWGHETKEEDRAASLLFFLLHTHFRAGGPRTLGGLLAVLSEKAASIWEVALGDPGALPAPLHTTFTFTVANPCS